MRVHIWLPDQFIAPTDYCHLKYQSTLRVAAHLSLIYQ